MSRTRTADPQCQTRVDTRGNVRQIQRLDARRGQLEGQWQTIQTAADLGHQPKVAIGKPEPWRSRLRAGQEQTHGLAGFRFIALGGGGPR